SPRRRFSPSPGQHAAGLGRGPRFRSPGHAGDRRHTYRSGAMDSDGGSLKYKFERQDEEPMAAIGKTMRSAADLHRSGLISAEQRAAIEQVASHYALALTPAIAELIDPSDPSDPIARQFIPQSDELDRHAEESADPIGDAVHSPVEGVVHRYPDRALLKLVHVCAVYCRFCFRRERVGPAHATALSAKALAE